jgi:FixJ family two-component response regulator
MNIAQPITPTVFLVDDDDALRTGLSQLLENAGLAVEAFANGMSFLSAYKAGRPGCLLLDVTMPVMGGVELQEELTQRGLKIPIVFLTGHGDIPLAVKALQSGAADFLEKPFDADVLIERIQKALGVDEQCRQMEGQAQIIRERLDQLTLREQEVMALVVTGLSNKVIARQLGISYRTVEIHRAHVMHKMKASNLAELVHLATLCRE